MNRTLFILAAGALAGCGQPAHLQFDYGRAFEEALQTQADLGRPSVANSAYQLSGFEGIELRQRVVEQSTDAESGEVEAVGNFDVE